MKHNVKKFVCVCEDVLVCVSVRMCERGCVCVFNVCVMFTSEIMKLNHLLGIVSIFLSVCLSFK